MSVAGCEDCTAKQQPRLRVPVHAPVERKVELEFLSDYDWLQMAPCIGSFARYVDESHRVVAPVGDGQKVASVGCRYHFGEWSGLEHTYNRVGARVDYGHGRGVLGVDVERAPVVGHPQITPAVGEGHFNGLAAEWTRGAVGIVCPGIEP